TLIGDAHWLRIPLGKLHNDRYVPLHPHLVELLETYRQTHGAHPHGRLLSGQQGPLNRYAVQRWITAIATTAGIGHVHPHQLRHTLATQAINRGMSMEAIAALLGHRSLDMTRRYARISNRVVADEYNAVSTKVEALYRDPALPADAEGPNMRRLRAEVHHRLLGKAGASGRRCWTATSSRSARHAPTSPPTPPSSLSFSGNGTTPPRTTKTPAQRSSISFSTTCSRRRKFVLDNITYISPVTERRSLDRR
ncbi:MAG: tyrosine-type recombinase/integrase, partial [Actinobacteria bacterium]|nr:tyrosine-type recombinase/integrase [Actinomycetota bacterium]